MVERIHFTAVDNFPGQQDHAVSFLTLFFSFVSVKACTFMRSGPDEDRELSKVFPSLIHIKVEIQTTAHAHTALGIRNTN